MTERREVAEIYSRSEMELHNDGVRDREYVLNPRLCEGRRNNEELYVIRGNADGFQTLSESRDDDMSVRDSTASRFLWNTLLNESKGGSSYNGVREGSELSRYVSRDRNYDGFVEKSLPIVSEMTRDVPSYDPNVSGSEYYGRSRNVTDLSIEDGRNYTVRDREYPPRVERGSVRQHYDDENGLRLCHEGGSHSSTPLSLSGGQCTPFRGIATERLPEELQYRSVDGIGNGGRIPTSRSSSYHRIPCSNAGRTSDGFLTEGVSPRGEYTLNVCKFDDYIHPESQKSWNLSRKTVSKDVYYDDNSVLGYNDQGGFFGIDAMNATLPRHHNAGYSRRDVVTENEYSPPQHTTHSLQKTPISDKCGGSRILHDTVHGVGEASSGRRNSYLDHSITDIHGPPTREEELSYERKARCMLYEGDYASSSRRIERVSLMDENTGEILETRDFILPEQSDPARKRRYEYLDQMSDAKRRTIRMTGAPSYDNRLLSEDDVEEFGLVNKYHHLHDELQSRTRTSMFNDEARHPSADFSASLQRPLSEPQESARGDVKKRLTFPHTVSLPFAPQLPWKQDGRSRIKYSPDVTHSTSIKTSGKAKGTDFKKKLKSVPQPVICPSAEPDHAVHSRLNKKQQQKLPATDSGTMNDSPRSRNVDPDQSALKVKPIEELAEDDKRFKQLVDEWFLKCIWFLNSNINWQKRVSGKEIGGKLKCIICSSYKEFIETKDVAMHAFTSTKVGYRAQHLGFHRALCVFMGWDRVVTPNGRWVCKPLPEHMACTLKADVIIWPPVVIIHNHLATNYQLNEPGSASMRLKKILSDKGFASEIRGCYEDPGNPNIMVVKFTGIVPGLKEAERLHNYFAENKHGRAELGHIDPDVVSRNVVDKRPANELSLADKSGHYQEPVDMTEDEQHKFKIVASGSEDVDKRLDTTKVDQQPLDKAVNDQESVVKAHNGQEPLDNVQDDQEPLMAQDDQKPLDEARNEQEPLDKAHVEQGPLDKARVELGLLDKARVAQGPLDEAQDEQEPLDKAQVDERHIGKMDDDQVLVNNSDDQAVMTKGEDDSVILAKMSDDLVPTNKIDDDQAPSGKVEYAEEPVGMIANDQKPVGKIEETLYGYLGIIEDLSKIHKDLKRHHLARSKKEILASFNARM
ncbi:hypothetical protein vseg_010203 [Gypsophila vaccaria]